MTVDHKFAVRSLTRNMTLTDALLPFERKLRLLQDISEEARDRLGKIPMSLEFCRAGTILRVASCATGQVKIVAHGSVATYKLSGDGSRQILAVHFPGDILNLDTVLNGDTGIQACALSSIALVVVQAADLMIVSSTHKDIQAALLLGAAIDAASSREWLFNVGCRPAMNRLANLLCDLETKWRIAGFADVDTRPTTLTQEIIADCAALTSVHANRKIKELRNLGAVIGGSRPFPVCNWEKMRELGDYDGIHLGPLRKFVP